MTHDYVLSPAVSDAIDARIAYAMRNAQQTYQPASAPTPDLHDLAAKLAQIQAIEELRQRVDELTTAFRRYQEQDRLAVTRSIIAKVYQQERDNERGAPHG